jgi:hypothetical protein
MFIRLSDFRLSRFIIPQGKNHHGEMAQAFEGAYSGNTTLLILEKQYLGGEGGIDVYLDNSLHSENSKNSSPSF